MGIIQFIIQKNIGLSWLGEIIIDKNIIGIAKVAIGDYKLIRSYGTFVHPNVLAYYLGICLLLTYFSLKKSKAYRFILLILSLGLITTFSKTAILAIIVAFLLIYINKKQQNVSRETFQSQKIANKNKQRRETFLQIIGIFIKKLKNFTVLLQKMFQACLPKRQACPPKLQRKRVKHFSQIKPINNQTANKSHKAPRKINKKHTIIATSILLFIFICSLFDHYIITDWQAFCITIIVIGIILAKNKKKSRKKQQNVSRMPAEEAGVSAKASAKEGETFNKKNVIIFMLSIILTNIISIQLLFGLKNLGIKSQFITDRGAYMEKWWNTSIKYKILGCPTQYTQLCKKNVSNVSRETFNNIKTKQTILDHDWTNQPIHNIFFHLWQYFGIAGIILYVFIIYKIYKKLKT